MLKRIKLLKNVGRFQNCNAANKQLEKLTILYGRNTYGKSTLGDVFSSIQRHDNELVTGRRTIPHNENSQKITLSLIPSDSAKEIFLDFENGTWTNSLPPGLGIKVFDDGFIHRNVVVARGFNRDVKENFSAFVLGEQGVQQAEAIATKKRDYRKISRELNQLKKVAFKDVKNLQSFLRLTPSGTIEESDAKLLRLQNEYADVRKQQKQAQAIRSRDVGAVLSWNANFSDGVEKLNQALRHGLDGVHKEAKVKVARHINTAFGEDQRAEQWIRQGVRQNNGEICQFCGQSLTDEAHKLLDLYRQAFDDAFDKHEATVKKLLDNALARAGSVPVNDLRVALAKNAASYAGYPELKNNQTYTSAVAKVHDLNEKIETLLVVLGKQIPEALVRLRAASTKKQDAPNAVLQAVDEASVISLESQVQQHVTNYNKWVETCNTEIANFKEGINAGSLQKRLEKIETDGKAERTNNSRIKLDTQCSQYIELNSQIDSLNKDIDGLEKQFQKEQSDYLKTFFRSLNLWFKRFGSNDFTLERGENNRGHTPIYFLKVTYKGKPINEASLSLVFSESDRRALALAVFWTQLQSLPEQLLAKQIVVLDDPLTSFDDHRITAVHSELTATIDKVRQIIVLSHYRHEIKMFFEAFRDRQDVRLLVLTPGGVSGTQIEAGDVREFLLTEHQRAFESLQAFVSGHKDTHSSRDLRIYFEVELNSRFASQIAEHKLSSVQLGVKIDKLFEHGVIADETKNECHRWRALLNPSHHKWTGSDLEDQRNTVRLFLDFIYNRLVRNSDTG